MLGAGDALHDRVDCLQVRRVRGERHLDFAIAEHLQVRALGTQVVFHVARTAGCLGLNVAFELVKDRGQWFRHNIKEHIQPAPVRHADNHLVQALTCGGVDSGVHERNERLGTLQREPFLAHVLGLQEGFERLCGVQLLHNEFLLRRGGLGHAVFQAILQPGAFVPVQNMGVFRTYLVRVGIAELR